MGERGQRGATFRVDEGLLHFRALVGSLGHARILLYGQALQGRFGLFGQRFFIIGTVIDAGAHKYLARQRLRLHWSLLLICIMLIVFSHLLFLFLFFLFCIVASRSCFYFAARFEMSHEYSVHMKIARTHCNSAFERFFSAKSTISIRPVRQQKHAMAISISISHKNRYRMKSPDAIIASHPGRLCESVQL